MNIFELGKIEENRTAKQSPDCTFAGEHYLHVYERYFEPRRQKVTKLLELGVLGGHSLRLWRDYFPNAQIIGMDIDPAVVFKENRITVLTGDQANTDDLARAASCGPFDIIVDDASHITDYMVKSFHELWGAVRPGGLYCIEDLGCTYQGTDDGWPGQKYNKHIPPYGNRNKMDDLIRLLIDDLDHKKGFVRSIHFHCMQMIIEKIDDNLTA